jgi:hypothetical protein
LVWGDFGRQYVGSLVVAGGKVPVLMLLNARPTRPSDLSDTKVDETLLASSITWLFTVVPPITTVSVPQTPLAPDPSAYEMSHLQPEIDL